MENKNLWLQVTSKKVLSTNSNDPNDLRRATFALIKAVPNQNYSLLNLEQGCI